MVGNPSIHAIAIYTLALHATQISHRGVVAKEASVSFDEYYDNDNISQRKLKQHLRRKTVSDSSSVELDLKENQHGRWREYNQHEREQFDRDGLESLGAASIQDPRLVAIEGHDEEQAVPLSAANEFVSHVNEFGTGDIGCNDRQWYPDFNNPKMACTNSLDYPASWNPSIMQDMAMFDSSEACCNSLVELMGDSYSNENCMVIDECRELLSTTAIAKLSVASTKQQHRKLTCGELGFHPKNTLEATGCTNDEEYPPAWTQERLKGRMFHPAGEACCAFFFNGDKDCSIVDVCNGGDSTPTPPAITPDDKSKPSPPAATPDDNKKPPPPVSQQNTTPNKTPPPSPPAAAPDNTKKPSPPVSPQNTSPNKAPSPSSPSGTKTKVCFNKWHVDMVTQDGCSNDEHYPSEWLAPGREKLMFFDTPERCCTVMFSGKSCAHNYSGCGNGDPVPTKVKLSINPPPTRRPVTTPPPTTAPPTPKPKVYWLKQTNGMCVDEEDEPRPHWIKDSYPAYEECCMYTRDPDACRMAQPTQTQTQPKDPNRPIRPPVMKPFSFYVDPSSGLCVEETEMAKPAWVETTYPVYEFCCKDEAVRDEKLCMKARPTKINGISFGTLAPTQTPDPKYYADPGSGMCVSEADKPKPSHVTATFDSYSRCCILASSSPETCLTRNPQDVLTSEAVTSAPTSSPPADYYLQQSTAICVDLNTVTNPGWVAKSFGTDYDSCCKTSWNMLKCMAMKPSLPPTEIPTYAPSTPWPTETAFCPEPYNPSTGSYVRGSEVERNFVIWRCIGHPVYCNNPEFQPPLKDPGPEITYGSQTSGVIIAPDTDGIGLWDGVWERVFICVNPPSAAPSGIPTTGRPTCESARWHPGAVNRRICTNSAVYPETWNIFPLSETYFADTAEQCCNKFYGGVRCRMKDVCS